MMTGQIMSGISPLI
ncbi:hypothetical protein [Peribacillus muralis]